MSILLRLVALALLVSASLAASAHSLIFSTTLTGPAEAPPNDSAGIGAAIVTVDLDLATLRVQSIFAGLEGVTTAAHIHCCTTVAGEGTAGVASIVPSFPAFPLGVTTGTFDETYDLTNAASYRAAFITANGGTVSGAMNALIAGLGAGSAYFNVHTDLYPGGEIRGFFAPTAPIPVPAAIWLMGPAVAGLALRRRRAV